MLVCSHSAGAVLGAVLVVFFLKSTRLIVPLTPNLTAVRGAALRELLISAARLVILRFYAKGLLPERIDHPVVTATARS